MVLISKLIHDVLKFKVLRNEFFKGRDYGLITCSNKIVYSLLFMKLVTYKKFITCKTIHFNRF